ncbi:MAG: hypothetical protein ABIQ16_08595 [Polyangiaceae bacterium]
MGRFDRVAKRSLREGVYAPSLLWRFRRVRRDTLPYRRGTRLLIAAADMATF